MLILDLWSISIHAVVVFGLGKNLLFKSALGHCAYHAVPSPFDELVFCAQITYVRFLFLNFRGLEGKAKISGCLVPFLPANTIVDFYRG